jgi:hypothetical protein
MPMARGVGNQTIRKKRAGAHSLPLLRAVVNHKRAGTSAGT